MARILTTEQENSTWYDELSLVASYYESHFEKVVMQHVSNVFQDYFTVPYKKEVIAEGYSSKKPDLAMVRNDYKEWWIVEVELVNHTLKHVMGQVKVFARGDYNSNTCSQYIVDKGEEVGIEEIDLESTRDLILKEQPNILVIVDEPVPAWEEDLKKEDAKLCIFQIFKNKEGHQAFRLKGEFPHIKEDESHCKYDDDLNNTLLINNPNFLTVSAGEEIEIMYQGRLSKWKRMDDNGEVYLRNTQSINPVPRNKSYVLYKDTKGRFRLKLN